MEHLPHITNYHVIGDIAKPGVLVTAHPAAPPPGKHPPMEADRATIKPGLCASSSDLSHSREEVL